MADFNVRIWDNERVYMVAFERATVSSSVPLPQRQHPHRSCPDIDTLGHMNDAQPAEHGPMICARVGQGNVRVVALRSEISTAARLYARSADRSIVRVAWPSDGLLPSSPRATLVLSPRA